MRHTAKEQVAKPPRGRISVDSIDQIPVFESDEEELAFWETHEPGAKMMEDSRHMTLEEMAAQVDLPER